MQHFSAARNLREFLPRNYPVLAFKFGHRSTHGLRPARRGRSEIIGGEDCRQLRVAVPIQRAGRISGNRKNLPHCNGRDAVAPGEVLQIVNLRFDLRDLILQDLHRRVGRQSRRVFVERNRVRDSVAVLLDLLNLANLLLVRIYRACIVSRCCAYQSGSSSLTYGCFDAAAAALGASARLA